MDMFSYSKIIIICTNKNKQTIYESLHEKTNSLGFRPGPTKSRK